MQRHTRQTSLQTLRSSSLLSRARLQPASQPSHTLTPRAGSSKGTGSNVRFTRQWSRLSLPCSTTSRGREVGGYTSNAVSSSAPKPPYDPSAAGGYSAGRGRLQPRHQARKPHLDDKVADVLRLVVGDEILGGRLALLGQPAGGAGGGRRRRGRRVTGGSGTGCLCGHALKRTAAWQGGRQRCGQCNCCYWRCTVVAVCSYVLPKQPVPMQQHLLLELCLPPTTHLSRPQVDSSAADTVATVATALLCPAAAADCSCAATFCTGSEAVTLAVKGVMLLASASADTRCKEQHMAGQRCCSSRNAALQGGARPALQPAVSNANPGRQ